MVELPDSLAHCWYWFLDLNNTRQNGMGMSAISFLEMKAYFALLQIAVEPWEIEVIKMFDRVALSAASKQQEEERQAQQRQNKNKKK